MIEKLERKLRRERDGGFTISGPVSVGELQEKINELVDVVNALVYEHDKDSDWHDGQTRADNVQPDYVTTTYMADGHTKEYYGQNGASIVTDHPLPAGYVITIKESETKGGDNE
jgi:hypothetical protein